jgi:hypothetical protein
VETRGEEGLGETLRGKEPIYKLLPGGPYGHNPGLFKKHELLAAR